MNLFDDQLAVIENNGYESAEYFEAWDAVYNERSKTLKTLVEDYGLAVGEGYQESLDEILSTAKGVEKKDAYDEAINGLVENAEWTKEDDGYGYFTYTAVIENTSEYDFEDVSINLGLYDADDVRTESWAGTNSWKKGEKAKYEAFAEVDAERTEAKVEYYKVAGE